MCESVFMDNVVNRFLEVFFEEAWPSWARYLRRTGNSEGLEEDGVVDKRKLKKADGGFAIKSRPFLLVEAKRPAACLGGLKKTGQRLEAGCGQDHTSRNSCRRSLLDLLRDEQGESQRLLDERNCEFLPSGQRGR